MAKFYSRTEAEEIPAPLLVDFIHQLFDRVKYEVLAREEISESEKSLFMTEAKAFEGHLKKILSSKSHQRETVLRALARALSFSFYHPGGNTVIRELRADGVSGHSSKAGRASGKSRRALAEETWQAHTLELAKKARIQMPDGTLDDIADYVFKNWKLKIKLVSRHWIKRFISKKIQEGSLSPKSKSVVFRNRKIK